MNLINIFKKKQYPAKDFTPLETIPQMGDAILIHDLRPNIIGDGIEFFTDGDVAHTDIYVGGGDGGIIGYTAEGCTRRNINMWFKPYYKVTLRRIKDITINQASKMKEAAYNDYNKHKPYDFLSYIGFIYQNIKRKLFKKKIDDDSTESDNPVQGQGKVCSTGYIEWTKEAGLDLFPNIGDESVTPQHIFKSKKFETIIEI